MSRALDDLTREMRPLAMELIARATDQGIAVLIVDTLRTAAEQAANLAKGVSWTLDSKHLPQKPSGLSDAIDLVLYETYQLHGPDKLQWDTKDPAWLKLGLIGEKLGLRWGGRWKTPDSGHFELVRGEFSYVAARLKG